MKHFLFLHEFYTSYAMIKLIIYQKELALLLIQASPHPLLVAFRNPRRGLT